MKDVTYTIFAKFWHMAKVVALCGGSDDVRYGRANPEKLFVAELDIKAGELIWLFVQVQGEHRVAAQVQWNDLAWTSMALYGIQPSDCPVETWNLETTRGLRERTIPAKWLTFEQALATHLKANPGTTHTAEFTVSE